MNLKAFSLLFHILQEDAQIGGNAVTTFQVLHVLAGVELLTKLLAHSLDVDDGLWEPDVGLTSILETDWSKYLKLLVLALQVSFFVRLFDNDRLLGLAVADTIEFFKLLFEASTVESVVSDRADHLHNSHSHFDGDRFLGVGNGCLVQSQVVIVSFLTKVLQLVDKLVNTFLGLFTLGHLRTHALLSESAWLTIRLAETFLGGQLLDA